MKQSFIAKLQNLVEQNNPSALHSEVKEVKNEFFTASRKQRNDLFEQYKADGGDPNEFEAPKDPLDNEFKGLLTNFGKQMKQSFIAKLQSLVEQNNPSALRSEVKEVKNDFFTFAREQRNALFEQYKANGGNLNEFEAPNVPLDDEFKGFLTNFNEQMQAFREKREAEIQAKLDEKWKVLEEFKTLKIEGNQLGQAFEKLKTLQEKWKAIGNVRSPKYKEIQIAYNHQNDLFYHDVTIYKGLRDLDHGRNLEAKNAVLTKVATLHDMEDIRQMDRTMKKYQQEWKTIGQVPMEARDELNERYKELTGVVYDKVQAYYDEKRGELDANLKAKIGLCEQVNGINQVECNTHQEYQAQTEDLMKVQQAWKAIGFSSENEKIWQVFRGVCDKFFEKKRDFYKVLDQRREESKLKKIALCEAAEEVKNDTDWRATTDKLVKLQKDWKSAGPARRSEDNKLWERFRAACDTFFEAKRTFFQKSDEQQVENLGLKETLIASIKNTELEGDRNANLQQLKEFSNQWNLIGHVPIADKDRIYKSYHEALDEQYTKLKVNAKERAVSMFQDRLENLKSANNSDSLIKREQRAIKDKIQRLQDEVAQYEHNMGFFKGRGKKNPLLKDIHDKINRNKAEVMNLKQQLKIMAIDARKAKEEQAAAEVSATETIETAE
ncbi:MAG: DUF349 domain-containing protein [Chitinophagales bacterium]